VRAIRHVEGPRVVNQRKGMGVKRLFIGLAIGALALACVSCGGEAPRKTTLESEIENVSYAYGMDVASVLKRAPIEFDTDVFMQGFKDAYLDGELLMTETEKMQILQDFMMQMREEQMAMSEAESETNMSDGQAFLDENKTKEGVMTTASGLQYMVLEQGSGPRPSATSKVKVHYEGKFINGEKFDSSLDRGVPAEFPLNAVIGGWTEGLQLMPVGSKYRLFVPSELAYGERGMPPTIGPNATLIFEVELLEIVE
jgi:FKBP-type peptidyl-prolyl cis-trans isomerase